MMYMGMLPSVYLDWLVGVHLLIALYLNIPTGWVTSLALE